MFTIYKQIIVWFLAITAAVALWFPGATHEQSSVDNGTTITLEGRLTGDDYERLLERDFDVPATTRRIAIDLRYTGADRRTVLDLGMRGPSGLRGWSGGGRSHVEVSALTATPGYLPGPIEAGRWAVLLGVPNIRSGSDDTYAISIHLWADDVAPRETMIAAGPRWYAGDLHTHSMHSDGRARASSGADTPAPPFRVFEAAAQAGLDFVALTDHNTVSHWLDVDRLQPYFDRTLLLHGRELTTYRGHATVIGERHFNEFRLAAPTASPSALLRTIAADRGFVSINHPTLRDDESCMGCGWNVVDDDVLDEVQGVEVLNGDGRDAQVSGWTFWARLLNRGFHLTAVAGSDNHTVDDPRNRSVGVPATMVYATALSEDALIAGLRGGRVYVRTQGPTGPSLEFWAEAGGQRYEMGGTVPSGMLEPLTLCANITDADDQTVEWVKNGEVFATDRVDPRGLRRTVQARAGDWFSLRARAGTETTLLSSAIYTSMR